MPRKSRPMLFQDVAGRDARLISMLVSSRVQVDWVTDPPNQWQDKTDYSRQRAQAEFDALNLDIKDVRARIAARLNAFIKEGQKVLAAKGMTLTVSKLVFDDRGQYVGYSPTQEFTLTTAKGYTETFRVTWEFRGEITGHDSRGWSCLRSYGTDESLMNFGHLALIWGHRNYRQEAVRALQAG